MHPISWFIENPVKVAVGIILVTMFGGIAMFNMPMQLTPNVQRPTLSVSANWPGASPQEIEKEIVSELEERLTSVQGVTKMNSSCGDAEGEVDLEFAVGTNMDEALLKVNSQLQTLRDYPLDADPPTIRSSNSNDRSVAWFILSTRPPSTDELEAFADDHPELKDELQRVAAAQHPGLRFYRLNELAAKHPVVEVLLKGEANVTKFRKFAEEAIESEFERVSGVSDANIRGGEQRQIQVVFEPDLLAARGLTIEQLRNALVQDNQDVSAGDFWEGKRRYVVRTLGQYRDIEEVRQQIITTENGQAIYIGDVADVRVGFQKPTGSVKRYGMATLSISITRETGANSIDVVAGLDAKAKKLNETVLASKGLILNKVYDETVYINSAVGLVQQNIMLGGALTVIILMLFLHLRGWTLIFVPLLVASSLAAIFVSTWFFLATLGLILIAGAWFARGTLVVALAIPTSIVGTFLILSLLDRSLNVISLAGLAFAIGMLVDSAVVVLENIYRFRQLGHAPMQAARLAVGEVWGAILASTLTTLAVFLPVIFLQGEAGQLFMDIALAISAAVGLSLIVSVIVIPTASARLIDDAAIVRSGKPSWLERFLSGAGKVFTDLIVGVNRLIQKTIVGRVTVVAAILALAIVGGWWLMPEIEYLPAGNRNLVFSRILPPPGYNVNQLAAMGAEIESTLKPYWDIDPVNEDTSHLDYPVIADYFFVARGRSVFVGLRAHDPMKARQLIDLIKDKLGNKFPGAFVTASQSSLFGRGLGGGRDIDIEIQGPELEQLVKIGADVLGGVKKNFPKGTQARPNPGLDLSSSEVHVRPRPEQAMALGITNSELGYVVNTLIDGAYASDYFLGGEKIDLVLLGAKSYESRKQDLEQQYIATRNSTGPIRLGTVASIEYGSGPEEVVRRERERAITIEVSPPDEISLEAAIAKIESQVIQPLKDDGTLGGSYKVNLSGTADKLAQTWEALRWNFLLAILITYLLMAALFESWIYPLVIILSVPMGAVGGIIGLKLLGVYLEANGLPAQSLDVLTMLGFVILVGTVVNNAILIVHQSLVHLKEGQSTDEAISNSIRNRIRPIFMTTLTTVVGLSPLVFFPGAGSELYRGLGSVVLGGMLVSTFFTLVLVPTLFSLMLELKSAFVGKTATASS